MSKAQSRLSNLVSHFAPSSASPTAADNSKEFEHRLNFHSLSPTYFLPRAAAIEPDASCPSFEHRHATKANTTRRRRQFTMSQ
jgi:hypothetical protein